MACDKCNGDGWSMSSRWHHDEQGAHEEIEGLRACGCDVGGNLAMACAEQGFEALIYA